MRSSRDLIEKFCPNTRKASAFAGRVSFVGSSGESVGNLRVLALGLSEEAVKLAAGGVEGALLVTLYYSGNLGIVHDVDTILDAIEHFRNDARFRFLFAGGGSRARQHGVRRPLGRRECAT